MVVAVRDEFAELLLVHEDAETPLADLRILRVVAQLLGQDLVEDEAAERAADEAVARDLHADLRLQVEHLFLIREECLGDARERLALALCAGFQLREVVRAEHHVLRRDDDGLAVLRREDVVCGEHEDARLRLRLRRERQMDGHLVAVKVRVVCRTRERMQLQRTPLGEHRLKGLDAQTVQCRCTVEEHGMLLDDILKHVPDLGACALDHALCRLDVVGSAVRLQFFHDKGLEELKCHFLRQAALVELQLRADDDNGTSRVVDTLAEEVLTETSLLALEHIRERLQRAVAGSRDGAAAAAIVDERVHRLLQHALLVAHDDVGRTEVKQAAQAVVAVDDAAIEVVEIRGRKASAVELHHGAQVRRNDGHDVHDHPRRLIAGLAECLNHLKAADGTHLLLSGGRPHVVFQLCAHLLKIQLLKELLDRLRAHADAEGIAVLFERIVILALGEQFLFLQIGFARIEDDVVGEVEHLLKRTRGDIEDESHAARNALEVPDMRDGCGELDMPHALAAHLCARHLDAAAVADNAFVSDALVLSAVALPVACRSKDALAEEAVTLGLQGTIVDGLRLFYLAVRPCTNFIGRSESDPHRVKIVYIQQQLPLPSL